MFTSLLPRKDLQFSNITFAHHCTEHDASERNANAPSEEILFEFPPTLGYSVLKKSVTTKITSEPSHSLQHVHNFCKASAELTIACNHMTGIAGYLQAVVLNIFAVLKDNYVRMVLICLAFLLIVYIETFRCHLDPVAGGRPLLDVLKDIRI